MDKKNYSWVVDRAKFEAACTECGPNATEEQIRAAYVRRAGLIRGAGQHDWKKEVAGEKKEEVNGESVSYRSMKMAELRALCDEKGIDHRGMDKDTLISALEA